MSFMLALFVLNYSCQPIRQSFTLRVITLAGQGRKNLTQKSPQQITTGVQSEMFWSCINSMLFLSTFPKQAMFTF